MPVKARCCRNMPRFLAVLEMDDPNMNAYGETGPMDAVGIYAEQSRLRRENNALRALLQEWHDLFAAVRVDGTEGARLLDRTADALSTELRYKTV